ncbi:glycosyltransferase [Pseudanabaena biceps]|nr:glycosyltransferase [Pseudanabaena biceps]
MPYMIVSLELTQTLPTLQIPEDHTGVFLILRYLERPIGLLLRSCSPEDSLTPTILEAWIAQELGTKLLQEQIRSEIFLTPNAIGFPSLTVAICTKDRPENVSRLLRSLLPLQANSLTQFEILVVDNAPSDDRTKDIVTAIPSICYTRELKAGLNFARNHALHAATGELLAFLDDDVTVDQQWLNGLKEAWAENPDAAAFTGLVLPYELETEAQILFEQRGGFRRGFEKIRYGQTLPNNPSYPCGAGIFGAGCNMAFRRSVLLELGGFDEALDTGRPLPGGGDLDIFYRVVRAGYPLVYEPQYLVYHQHRRELHQLQHQYWTWGLGLMAFVGKSFQVDRSQRIKLLHLMAWWLKNQIWQLQQSLTGQHVLPISMVLAEFWGGMVGVLGEYGRSQKRVAQIRRRFS